MKERLRGYIDKLFEEAPKTDETLEVKEELLANLLEHYSDLIDSGKSEEEAYQTVINNIGDISEVIASLKEANRYEKKQTDGSKNNTYEDKSWTIGSMIDNVIGNIASAFDTDYPVVNDQSYKCEGINCINLDFVSESIKLFLHDKDELRLVEYMSKIPTSDELAKVDSWNGDFNIKSGRRLFFIAKSRVEIYLPRNFHGDMNIKVTSSGVKSGEELRLRNVAIKGISCSTSLETLDADNIDIHVTSGSIKINKMKGRYNLSTESGSVKLNEVTGGGDIRTTSGSITVNYRELQGAVTYNVISGSTRITIPQNTSFRYDVSVISGSIHTCLDASQYSSSRHSVKGLVGAESENSVYIKSVSGGVWLQNH